MRTSTRPTFLATVAALAVAAAIPAGARETGIAVTVDGALVAFDQPPVDRAGRLFVPLRGIFERLGASVVYAGGRINATSGPTTIALNVGSTAATVNGAPVQLDAAPFVAGARVLVPLRFIAQALGAGVTYRPQTRTVAIVPRPEHMPRRLL